MPIKFKPKYTLTPKIVGWLMRIEAIKEKVLLLPLTVKVYASLRETARLYTTHYSTMIEGNQLEPQEIEQVLKHKGHFPGRQREEHEVKGYYSALIQIEQWVAQNKAITERMIQTLHALVMSDGRLQVKPSKYRDGQNVIRDGRTRTIIYMPPEAKDVSISKQRKVLELFQEFEIITAKQISELFGFKPRTSTKLCKNWVEAGFLKIVDASK